MIHAIVIIGIIVYCFTAAFIHQDLKQSSTIEVEGLFDDLKTDYTHEEIKSFEKMVKNIVAFIVAFFWIVIGPVELILNLINMFKSKKS